MDPKSIKYSTLKLLEHQIQTAAAARKRGAAARAEARRLAIRAEAIERWGGDAG